MKYKIHHEPLYVYECKALLENIVNGKSIRDEMDEFIKKRGASSVREKIEPLFQKAIELEDYVKEHIKVTKEMEFMCKKWEGMENAPIDAVIYYDQLLTAGIDNKAAVFLFGIDDTLLGDEWGLKDLEAGTPLPAISDIKFFSLLINSHLGQNEKLQVMQLFYEFDKYRAFTHDLLNQTEKLIKNKLPAFEAAIKTHMSYVEENLLANNAVTLRNVIGISTNDNMQYDIYPGIYKAHSVSMDVTGFIPPYVTIGMSAVDLWQIYDSIDSAGDKATQFLKLLSDSTKQTILKLLKNEPLYGSQLAEKLNCSSANVSQHMNALLELEVVHVQKENNRVYFHLNKEAIRKHFDAAKELFT